MTIPRPLRANRLIAPPTNPRTCQVHRSHPRLVLVQLRSFLGIYSRSRLHCPSYWVSLRAIPPRHIRTKGVPFPTSPINMGTLPSAGWRRTDCNSRVKFLPILLRLRPDIARRHSVLGGGGTLLPRVVVSLTPTPPPMPPATEDGGKQ